MSERLLYSPYEVRIVMIVAAVVLVAAAAAAAAAAAVAHRRVIFHLQHKSGLEKSTG